MNNAHLHSEQWVIGAVMLSPSGFDEIVHVGLTADSFVFPSHAEIWRAIEKCAATGQAVDPLNVYEQSRACGAEVKLNYLVELVQGTYGVHGLKSHAKRVKEREIERGLKNAGLQIAAFADDPEQVVQAKLEKAQGLVSAIGRVAVRSAPRSVADIAIEQTAKWEDVQAGRVVPGWPTRIPSIDRALNGGLKPGSLVILAARPAVGKSSFAQQLALTFATDGLPSLFLSQEMPATELADRACANVGRINYSAIQSGQLSPDDWSRASEVMESLARLPYSIDDQAALTLLDIRTKARMVPGVKVVFVDYLQLCQGEGDNRTAQIGAISRGLKALAKEMGICVVALSQLNRKVEERPNKRPVLSDLRDSGEIEQDADCIWFLWPVKDMGERRLIGFEIAKNHQGRLLQLGLDFYGTYQRWGESTEDLQRHEAPVRSSGKGGFDD